MHYQPPLCSKPCALAGRVHLSGVGAGAGSNFSVHKSNFCSRAAYPRTVGALVKCVHPERTHSPKVCTQKPARAFPLWSPPSPKPWTCLPLSSLKALQGAHSVLSTCCPLQAVQGEGHSCPSCRRGTARTERESPEVFTEGPVVLPCRNGT